MRPFLRPTLALLPWLLLLPAACAPREKSASQEPPPPEPAVAPAPAAAPNAPPEAESARLAAEYAGRDRAEIERLRGLVERADWDAAYQGVKLFLEAYPESPYRKEAAEILRESHRLLHPPGP